MDRGAWEATVHRVTKSWTRLSLHAYAIDLRLDHQPLPEFFWNTLYPGLSLFFSGFYWIWLGTGVVQLPSHVWLFATPCNVQTRLLCPSLSPGVCSNSCPLSRWCHPAISSSVASSSSCPQCFPASGYFLVSQFFASGNQNYWGFSFSLSPFSEYSRLISFRIDCFDVLEVLPQELHEQSEMVTGERVFLTKSKTPRAW